MTVRARSLIKKETVLGLITVIVIITPSVYKLLRPGFFSMYDDMQVIRLQQMDLCVRDGQIPCRWVPDLGYGYGYPLYQYYAPLPYYVMEAFHLFGFTFIDSVKIGFILSVLLSAFFFFKLARRFFSFEVSLASTALYIYLPARMNDLYVRGAMGELWGLAILPLFFLELDKFLKSKSRKRIVIFSLVTAIFLISHNLTVFMAIPLVFVWLILRTPITKESIYKNFKYYFLVLLIGFFLASFYLLPLIFERDLVHLETLTSGYFNYVNHFVSLKQLLFSMKWGYGPSVVGPDDDTNLSAGFIQILLVIVGLFIVLLSRRFKKEKYFWLSLFIFYWGVLFMTHSRSIFIWKAFPFLSILQFPFRFLIIAGFAGSLFSGVVFDSTPKKYIRQVVLLFIILLIIFYRQFLTPKDWFILTDDEKLSGELYQKQITASIYDYLPKSVKELPKDAAPKSIIVENGEVLINESERGSDWYNYHLEVKSKKAHVVIPAYDFPIWKVWVDNKPTNIKQYSKLGLLGIDIASGRHDINAKLTKSPSRIIGDSLTIIGFIFVFMFSFKEVYEKKTKQN
jgi:hypothetical protein